MSVAKKYTLKRVKWQKTDDAVYPYNAVVDGDNWRIRVNDFPEDLFYTLLVNKQYVGSFDGWPMMWKR